MKVRAIRASADGCPNEVRPFLAARVPVTVAREYDVHAVATFRGVTFLQIVDDLRYPTWQPSWLFEVVDKTIPSDWICNVFDDGNVVLGPAFVAKDERSYASMVELDSNQVDRFWNRIEAISSENAASGRGRQP